MRTAGVRWRQPLTAGSGAAASGGVQGAAPLAGVVLDFWINPLVAVYSRFLAVLAVRPTAFGSFLEVG